MARGLPAVLLSALLLAAGAGARVWTDAAGRRTEAKVVRVNPNRTVALQAGSGREFTLPFSAFSSNDVQYLEDLLANHGKLSPVSWERMNTLFGLDLWRDNRLWDDPTGEVAQRLEMEEESKTDFLENHRAYPLGKKSILGEPAYSLALYGGGQYAESLSFVFLNQGDLPLPEDGILSPSVVRKRNGQIEACSAHLRDALVPVLGKPRRDALGKGKLRERVWRWDWNGHAILLSLQEGSYVALRIMPTARADRGGRTGHITESDLKKQTRSCVEHRKNGDVVIRNIPMVDQGPKGYCLPATWERVLRYMDIPADMYLLALAARTGAGGGTFIDNMHEAVSSLVSANGRELANLGSNLDLRTVSKEIDQGLPIIWHMVSTPDFRRAIHENTARRAGKKPKKKSFGRGMGGHARLIIGYNKKTREIAISDSWGPKYSERWVKIDDARKVSGPMEVVRW